LICGEKIHCLNNTMRDLVAVRPAEQNDKNSVMFFLSLPREAFVRGDQKPSLTLGLVPDRLVGQALLRCAANVRHIMTFIL